MQASSTKAETTLTQKRNSNDVLCISRYTPTSSMMQNRIICSKCVNNCLLYFRKDEHDAIRIFFPSAEFEYIPDAGHWVHAEKPKEFVDILSKFIEKTDRLQ